MLFKNSRKIRKSTHQNLVLRADCQAYIFTTDKEWVISGVTNKIFFEMVGESTNLKIKGKIYMKEKE